MGGQKPGLHRLCRRRAESPLGLPRRDAQRCHPPRLIVAESAIDAMSYYQHDPAPALVLSFGGEMSPEQPELLRHVLTKYPAAQIVTATDADAQGDDYAALIEAVRPDAVRARPLTGKDWNETLRTSPAPR